MPVSKITNIQGSGTWEGSHGLMYKFDYAFEDGTLMQAMHKTQNSPFSIGQEALYEVKRDGQYGKSGSVKKPESALYQNDQQARSGGYKKQSGGNRSFALSYSKDIAVAHITAGKDFSATQIIQYANLFIDWLEVPQQQTSQKHLPRQQPQNLESQPQNLESQPQNKENVFDDLPF